MARSQHRRTPQVRRVSKSSILRVEGMEDRTAPAATSFAGGVLSIDFDTANENITITNSASGVSLSGSTFTGEGDGVFIGVNQINVTDSANAASQSLTIAGNGYILGGSLSVSGVESLTVNSLIIASSGSLSLSANDGIVLNQPISISTGNIEINADADGNGVGDLTISAGVIGGWVETTQLTDNNGAASDVFGRSIAISRDGNTAVVGATGANAFHGEASVFIRSGGTWIQQAQLTMIDSESQSQFGSKVAISDDGNTVIVGALLDDVGSNVNQGSAIVFTRTGTVWTQQQQLVSSDGNGNDHFGSAVGISGDGNTVIVGAANDDVGTNTDQGSAYLYTRTGGVWTQQTQLVETEGEVDDFFGDSLAVSRDGNTVMIGVNGDDVDGNVDQGSAIVFTRSGEVWTQGPRITDSNGKAEDFFGYTFAISDDSNTAIFVNYPGNHAIAFTRTGSVWTEQQQLVPSDVSNGDEFGFSVSLSGDGNTAVFGSRLDQVGAISRQGTATVFTRSGGVWTQTQQLTAHDGTANDQFGYSVAISNDGQDLLVATPFNAVGTHGLQGSVYAFELQPDTPADTITTANGSISVTAANVFLEGSITSSGTVVFNANLLPTRAGVDINATSVSFVTGSKLTVDLAGPTVDTQASQLNINGDVNLTGVDLVLTGSYVFDADDLVTILNANSVTGTFNGLTDGDTIPFRSRTLIVNKTATDVTLKLDTDAVNTQLVGVPEFAVGGPGTVTVYNSDGSESFNFEPFSGFTGDVRTAVADFNGDGVGDIVVGTGPGAVTQVRVIDGVTKAELHFFSPFETTFTGGVFVAAGDINGDGKAELAITPDEGGGPRVRVFNGDGFTQIADFFGIEDTNFRGGARASIGDMNGDGKGDLTVAAGFGGGPRIATFDGSQLTSNGGPKLYSDFFAFEATLRNGAFVATGDVNGDGYADLVAGGGPGGGPRVYILDGKSLTQTGSDTLVPLGNFFAGNVDNRGGIRVAVKDLDGDFKADVTTGAGTNAGSRVTAYLGLNISPSGGTPATVLDFDAIDGHTGGVFVG
ncbi:MAG: hypothetical protein U0798_19750 [Gemmataceae bacterium]